MCWSREVSLITFATSLAAGLFGLSQGVAVSPLYFNFISIQLAEAGMWHDAGCGGLNQACTAAGILLIATQPMLKMYSLLGGRRPGWAAPAYAAATALILAVLALRAARDPSVMCTVRSDRSAHLSWRFLPGARSPVVALWFAAFFASHLLAPGPLPALSGLAQAALVAYSMRNAVRDSTWGSRWCYFSNAASLVVLAQAALAGRITRA